jgi:hypothetical protein
MGSESASASTGVDGDAAIVVSLSVCLAPALDDLSRVKVEYNKNHKDKEKERERKKQRQKTER